MKGALQIFKSKWVIALFSITLLQQLLVASGTYFLGELTRLYPTDGFQIKIAVLLFICIFLPGTIVHYFIVLCTVKSYKATQLNYLNEYLRVNYNHPTHWRNEESRQQRHDMMCKCGQETIQSSINYFADVTATSLNIILNTISIILVTDFILGAIILVAGFAGLALIHFSGKSIADKSRQEILAENQLNSHLNKSWDNIILGNELFFNRWKNHFKELFFKSEKSAIDVVKKKDWLISLAAMVTNGIVIGGALLLAWFNHEKAGFVLAILVMLPRSLQIVMHIQIIQTYLAQWKNLKEKIEVTFESVKSPAPFDLTPMIKNDSLCFRAGDQHFPLNEIENVLSYKNTGRYTLTGPNGAGKSSLLLKLKSKFNSRAIYLPAQHQLMLNEKRTSLSTGEAALSALKDLQTKDNSSMLFLDEWDANLSAENRQVLDKIIDQMSKERIVVEIRHFHK